MLLQETVQILREREREKMVLEMGTSSYVVLSPSRMLLMPALIRNGWCGVCDPDALKPGDAGYCGANETNYGTEIPTVNETSHLWGFCQSDCGRKGDTLSDILKVFGYTSNILYCMYRGFKCIVLFQL